MEGWTVPALEPGGTHGSDGRGPHRSQTSSRSAASQPRGAPPALRPPATPAHCSPRGHTALHGPFPCSACPSLKRSVAVFLADLPASPGGTSLMFPTQPIHTLVVARLRFHHNRSGMLGSGCSGRVWLL